MVKGASWLGAALLPQGQLAIVDGKINTQVYQDIIIINPFFSPIGSYSLVSSLQLPYGLGKGEGQEPCIPRNTTQSSRTASWQCPLNLEASCINVSEETCTAPDPPQESLVHDSTRTSLSAKPSPNPDDAGPIVWCPMGLLVTADCDRPWTWTQNI
jgi:hypothetical protein